MATYIVLTNLTDQGIRSIKDQPQRIQQLEQRFAGVGIKIVEFYTTMGPYDNVVIVEGPDDETALGALLQVGMQGNARTTTLKAFPRSEAAKIIQSLP